MQSKEMFKVNETPPEHSRLMISLANGIAINDMEKLKVRCSACDVNLPPRQMEDKSAHQILKYLEQRRVFRPGKYEKLAEIFRDIQREDLEHLTLNGIGAQTIHHIKKEESIDEQANSAHNTETHKNRRLPTCKEPPTTETMYTTLASHPHIEPPLPPGAPSDVVLQTFAKSMGYDWKPFLIVKLGISDREISLIQQSYPHSPVQEHMFKALKSWRSKNANSATLSALIDLCETYPLDLDSYECLLDAAKVT